MEESNDKNNIKKEIQLEELNSINKNKLNSFQNESKENANQNKEFEDENGNLLDPNDLSYNNEE